MGGSSEPPSDPDCDHVEWGDTTRRGAFAYVEERTADDVLTICGVLESHDAYWQSDQYKFPVSETGSYSVSLVLSEPVDASAVFVRVTVPGSDPDRRLMAASSGNLARVFVVANELGGGHIVLEFDGDRPWDEVSVAYKLRIRKQEPPPPCEPVSTDQAAYSYAEAHDGADHKGNDELRRPNLLLDGPYVWPVSYPSEAEDTGIVVRPGERSLLQGESAAVPYPADDFNQDRDTFLIHTGDVNLLKLHIESPGGSRGLQVMIFEPGDLWPIVTWGLAIVMPNRSYWIWIGGFGIEEEAGAKPYTITICGEKFEP